MLIVIFSIALFIWLLYNFEKKTMDAHATVSIGTFMIIQGLTSFLGEFPIQTKIFAMINNSKFEVFSLVFYIFLLFILFLVL